MLKKVLSDLDCHVVKIDNFLKINPYFVILLLYVGQYEDFCDILSIPFIAISQMPIYGACMIWKKSKRGIIICLFVCTPQKFCDYFFCHCTKKSQNLTNCLFAGRQKIFDRLFHKRIGFNEVRFSKYFSEFV